MIRAIIFTAVGYWLSRQVYLRYDLEKRRSDQARLKRKLQVYLETAGWNKDDIQHAIDKIYKDYE